MKPWLAVPVASCVAGLLAATASAHTRSVSYSSWELHDRGARVLVRVPQLELTRLPWGTVSPPFLAKEIAEYLTTSLRLTADGQPCPVEGAPQALQAPRERAVIEWRVVCPREGEFAIESHFLLDVAPSHLHFARVRSGATAATERVLSSAEPRWALGSRSAPESAEPSGTSLPAYLWLGVEHIATGYDHLVFLLALLLLAVGIAEVVTIVTGFTAAHSITLGLAALGRVRPEMAAIEALIGLSIALVAAENAWILSGRPRSVPLAVAAVLLVMAGLAFYGHGAVPALTLVGLCLFTLCYFDLARRTPRPMRIRFAVAFCFGLIHGFGFAGVLAEMALPQGRLVPALLGFNLGVEVGQLALVAAVWPLLRWLADARGGAWRGTVAEAGTAAVFALGAFWLVERAYG